MEIRRKIERPQLARPCLPVPHKINRILYTLAPEEIIQLEPTHYDYTLHPQFIVRFSHHMMRLSGYPERLFGRDPAEIDLNFKEKGRETLHASSIRVKNFDTFEDVKMLLSPSLSELGVKEKFHEDIVKKIVECGNVIKSRVIETGGGGGGVFIPIVLKIFRLKAVWRCKIERCLAEIGLREARDSAISELLNKDFPYHLNDHRYDYEDDPYDYYFNDDEEDDDQMADNRSE